MAPASPRARHSVQKILDAAARIFGAEGYQGASMGAVARAAGVSKGLLHYHFRSKEHLLLEAGRAIFGQLHARSRERFQRGERGLQPALEALDAIWAATMDSRSWSPFIVETMSLAVQDGPVRTDLLAFYAETRAKLSEGIRDVFEGSDLAFPPDRLALVIRAALQGLLVELALARTPEDLARVDRTYQDMRALFAGAALNT